MAPFATSGAGHSPQLVPHARGRRGTPFSDLEVTAAAVSGLQAGLEHGRTTSVDLVDPYCARIAAYEQAGPALDTHHPKAFGLTGRFGEPYQREREGAGWCGRARARRDYGVGRNDTLSASGAVAFDSGLPVLSLLRRATSLSLSPEDDDYEDLLRDTAALASWEGLRAYARSAELRITAMARRDPARRDVGDTVHAMSIQRKGTLSGSRLALTGSSLILLSRFLGRE